MYQMLVRTLDTFFDYLVTETIGLILGVSFFHHKIEVRKFLLFKQNIFW